MKQRSPLVRLYLWLSWVLCIGSLIGWPATHVLILITHPPELSSWTGHLLIGLSWLAIWVAALGVIVTADVRKEQDDNA